MTTPHPYITGIGSGSRGWYRCKLCNDRIDVPDIRYIPHDHTCDPCKQSRCCSEATTCTRCHGAGMIVRQVRANRYTGIDRTYTACERCNQTGHVCTVHG